MDTCARAPKVGQYLLIATNMPEEGTLNCYLREKSAQPQTLRYGIHAAIGICFDCGIGVCLEHSVKTAEAGTPLLCLTCAEHRSSPITTPRVPLSQPQRATR